jgi:ribosomal protein S6
MQKRENGVYVQVRFELDPAKVTELVNRYRLVEDVFRVQILAVDDRREAVLAAQAEAAAQRAAAKAQAEAAEAAAAE